MVTASKIYTAGLIVLKGEKLLLAFSKNKKAWYLPGGKIDENESAIEALQREIEEELNIILDNSKLKFYCHITAEAYGEINLIMEQECFIYDLIEEPTPGNEIHEIRFFDLKDYLQQSVLVPGVLIVFEKLAKDQKIYAS